MATQRAREVAAAARTLEARLPRDAALPAFVDALGAAGVGVDEVGQGVDHGAVGVTERGTVNGPHRLQAQFPAGGAYSQADRQVGARVFAAQCVVCHGATGNLVAGVDYKMTANSSLIAGYRQLDINKQSYSGTQPFDFNATLYGPFMALAFQF